MKKYYLLFLLFILVFACNTPVNKSKNENKTLAEQISANEYFPLVKTKAMEIMKTGFNAGDGYREVWIRDYNTHPAIDIYDNAMFIIALKNLTEMIPAMQNRWNPVKESIAENSRKHLWDEKMQKFIPHIYLEKGSPFPADFDENQIYYFGGTAIAIEAGLLTKEEIKISIDEMVSRVKQAGAASIGLTLYPPYPEGYFANKIMNPVYSYQNGGDWTWFGGRMIQELIKNGFMDEAYEQVQPMVKRVKDNIGFYERYSVNNEPRGSGTFRGEAGVLFSAIVMFEEWVDKQK